MQHGHAAALVPLVQDILSTAGTHFDALDLIAVTTGPGSFTGIRTGLSAARAFGLAHNIPVIGFTTLEVLAHQALAQRNKAVPLAAPDVESLCVLIDSRRAEVFFQFFGPDGAPRSAPDTRTPESIMFPENEKFLLVGDAVQSAAEKCALSPTYATRLPLAIDPEFLASLAEVRFLEMKTLGQTPPPPVPFYLRPPDVTTPAKYSQTRLL